VWPHEYGLQGAVLSAAVAAVLMVAGSSVLELAIILGLFGFALFLGDFGAGGAKGGAPKQRKVAPPLCQPPGAEARGGRGSAAQDARSGPAARRAAPALESAGDKQWYTQRIIEESRKHRWPIALRLLNEMQQAGHKPEPIVYNCMIADCKKGSRLERARALFERMESEGVKANVITYTALMNVAARREDADEALRLFGQMRERQVPPNNVTYNTLIQACSKARRPMRALEVLQEARRENGYAPEVKAQTSKELCAALQDAGVLPAGTSFAAVADAVVQAGSPEKALELARNTQAGDAATDGLGGHEEPLQEMFSVILEDLTRHDKLAMLRNRPPGGQPPGPAPAAPSPRRPAAAEEDPSLGEGAGSSVFGKLLQDYRDDRVGSQAPSQTEHRMHLFGALLRAGRRGAALELFETMPAALKSEAVEIGVHNQAIAAYRAVGQPEKAFGVMQLIRQRQLSPNVSTYAELISTCQLTGNGTKAIELIRELHSQGLKADAARWNVVIDILVSSGRLGEAADLLAEMRACKVHANTKAFSTLIGACERTGDAAAAARCLEVMGEHGAAGAARRGSAVDVVEKAGTSEEEPTPGRCGARVPP